MGLPAIHCVWFPECSEPVWCRHFPQPSHRISLLSVFAVNSTGCAAMVNGSKQTINFNSKPEGATFYAGSIKATTPAAIELKRSQDHFVKFEKDCFEAAHMPVNKDLSGWFWAGLVFWRFFEFISMGRAAHTN